MYHAHLVPPDVGLQVAERVGQVREQHLARPDRRARQAHQACAWTLICIICIWWVSVDISSTRRQATKQAVSPTCARLEDPLAPDPALVRVIQVLGQDHRAVPRRVAGALFIFIICTSTSIDRTDALFVSGLNPSYIQFTRSHIPARCSPPRAPRGAAPRSETRPLPNPRENGARAARASSSLLLPPLRSCRQSSRGCS